MGTTRHDNSDLEPVIGAGQLDEFFRELRRTVLDLEDAYQNDRLSHRLGEIDLQGRLGSAIAKSYQKLAKESNHRGAQPGTNARSGNHQARDPERRRIKTVHDLLSQMKEDLFEIDTWFHAEILESERPGDLETTHDDQHTCQNERPDPSQPNRQQIASTHRYLIRKNVDHPVDMRLDQILASRSWGIGYVFDDQEVTDQLVALMTRNVLRKFAQDLDDLASLLPRILRAASDRFPKLVPPRSGRAFEQLITDILNEDARHAHLSGLCEDYLQKTDIRVKYPDLDRKRGARVQVTIASSGDHHEKKVESIRHPEQFVILSPWSLASAVPQFGDSSNDAKRALFDDDLINRFWESIPGTPSDLVGLSKQIKSVMCDAIERPLNDPRGPMIHVPEPIRRFIRIWVHAEALRSTRALRLCEATEGRYRRGRDGRLRIRRLSQSSLSQSSLDFIRQHPSDSSVRAVVRRYSAQAAWVEFSDDLHGRIDRKEISWSDTNADPKRYFEIGREYEFKVRRVTASRTPAIVELSLKRTMADPWRAENLRNLASIGIVPGRVVRQTSVGLFVEVDKDLVGLLHESQLPPTESGSKSYFDDQIIPVTIEAINIKTRRMSLALAGHLDRSIDAT